jgi:hypothetical protein
MAQSGDKVWFRGRFAEGSNEVVTVWVDQRAESRAHCQCAALNEVERYMSGIVGFGAIEDGECTLAKRRREAKQFDQGRT